MTNKYLSIKLLTAVLSALLIQSCASPQLTTKDMQSRLRRNMSAADVMTALGTPHAQADLSTTDQKENRRILFYDQFALQFQNEKLLDINDLKNITSVLQMQQNVTSLQNCNTVYMSSDSQGLAHEQAELFKERLVKAGYQVSAKPTLCTMSLSWHFKSSEGLLSNPPWMKENKETSEMKPGLYYQTYYERAADRYFEKNKSNLFHGQMDIEFQHKGERFKAIRLNFWSQQNDEKKAVDSVLSFLLITPPQSKEIFTRRMTVANIETELSEGDAQALTPNQLLLDQQSKHVVPPYHITAFLNDEELFLEAMERSVDVNGFTMDSNALCVALRAGFAKATAALLAKGFDETIRIRNPLGVYIFPQDCITLQKDEKALAGLKEVILAHEKSQMAAEKNADPAVPKKSAFDWQKIKEFLEPVKPEKK